MLLNIYEARHGCRHGVLLVSRNVVSGSVLLCSRNRDVLPNALPILGDAAVPGRELLVSVVAAQDCKVLFMNMDKLPTECKKACPFHSRIIPTW